MSNIQHDKKKIEEIEQTCWEHLPDDITSEKVKLWYHTQVKPHIVKSMKQYAEHMVQQEREERERIEYDYSCVLDHATCGRMTKTNYWLNDIYSVIDEAQEESYFEMYADDINIIIFESKPAEAIEEIKKYFNLTNKDNE